MDENNYGSNKDDLTNRLIEQHKNLKRDHQELIEKYNKLQISSEAELNIERGEHKKTILELTKANKLNRELRQEIQGFHSKLILKEKEIEDLKVRLDAKNSLDSRLKERDLNLYSKNFGKNPTTTYDNKVVAIMRTYEEQKEKLIDENRALRQELESYSRRLRESSAEKGTLKREYSQVGEKITKEIINRVTELENENTILLRDNEALREHIEKINSELDNQRDDATIVRRKYDELRQRFNILESSTPNKNQVIDLNLHSHGDAPRYPKSLSTSKKTSIQDLRKPEDEFASLKAQGDLNDKSMQDMKKILNEIMEIYNIKVAKDIVPSIKKTEKVLQAIPRLQKLINDISQIVLMKAGYSLETPQVELLCPILKKWASELDEYEEILVFRDKLVDLLRLSKDDSHLEILKKVEQILQGQPLDSSKGKSGKETGDPRMLVDQFHKTFGVRPDLHVFKNIVSQLEDLNNFIKAIKGILNLDPALKNDATLSYAIRCLESARNPAINIVSQIQELLDCKVEEIVPRIESLLHHNKDHSEIQSEPDPYGLKTY